MARRRTFDQIVKGLAAENELSQAQTERVIRGLVRIIHTDVACEQADVFIADLGTFYFRNTRNVEAVRFRPCSKMKRKVVAA